MTAALRLFLVLLTGLVMAACASTGGGNFDPTAPEAVADPLEPLNRATFKFNGAVRIAILQPVAKVYSTVLPKPAQDGVRNAVNNLKSPVIFLNDLAQGEGKRGGKTLGRFLINSTLGIGGLFDVAKRMGLERHGEDFGQTLGVWGVGEGFYLVLPLLGPSSGRDAVGRAVDIVSDPFWWLLTGTDEAYLRYVNRSLDGIDRLARNLEKIKGLKRSSIDYYAAVKSAYIQSRRNAIQNEKSDTPAIPEFMFEEFDDTDGLDVEEEQDIYEAPEEEEATRDPPDENEPE